MKKVLLAMSGGVDSSTSALILMKSGYEVVGVTMRLLENEMEIEDAKRTCAKLEIEHHVLDLREEFKKDVIEDFIFCYKKGITPNPCVICNKKIKFGKLYEFSLKLGCDYFATGHYAKVEYDEELKQHVIKKANAKEKDQTYVLYGIDKQIVKNLIFPLGNVESKEQIRTIAAESGLDIANKADSQEICFIPNNDYASFIGRGISGDIIDKFGNKIGKHKGFINYTIGQRKGLGISSKTPLYVVGINPDKNEIQVGNESDLYTNEVYATNLNFLIPVEEEITAKIRYGANADKAKLCLINENRAKILFEKPQRAVTPGQSIVFYKDDILMGGGIITKGKE